MHSYVGRLTSEDGYSQKEMYCRQIRKFHACWAVVNLLHKLTTEIIRQVLHAELLSILVA